MHECVSMHFHDAAGRSKVELIYLVSLQMLNLKMSQWFYLPDIFNRKMQTVLKCCGEKAA